MKTIDFATIGLKELAFLICSTLKEADIDAVLVGGACVSFYTNNPYQSYDLDFVAYESIRKIERSLSKLGLMNMGRQFFRSDCPYIIDFVNPPVAVGAEPIKYFQKVHSASGSMQLLTHTDCVKDRLASYFDWNDNQALEQAVLVCRGLQKVSLAEVERWAIAEQHQEQFQEFLTILGDR